MLLALTVGRAQDAGQIDEETKLETLRRATKDVAGQIFKAQISFDPNNKQHLEAVNVEAKLATYPLIYRSNELEPPKPPSVTTPAFAPARVITDTHGLAESYLGKMASPKNRESYGELPSAYSRSLLQRSREVMLNGKPIVTLNAARIFNLVTEREPGQSYKEWTEAVVPRLRNGTAEELLSISAELITADPRKFNDGARIYLLRAAHDVLAMPPQKPALYKPETAEKVVRAAMSVATRKVNFPKATPRGEIEGFKILRAEALRVVGLSPVARFDKESPALLLARVGSNDESLNPPPRVEEFIEASIGLAQIVQQAARTKDTTLQADYAAQQIARAVGAFGKAAEANLESKGLARRRPWKTDAARMLEAIDPLRSSKDTYVADVGKRCRGVLLDIMSDRVGQGNVLATWADSTAPPSTSLFKGDAASTVKARGATSDD
jgi:hypothetical protein